MFSIYFILLAILGILLSHDALDLCYKEINKTVYNQRSKMMIFGIAVLCVVMYMSWLFNLSSSQSMMLVLLTLSVILLIEWLNDQIKKYNEYDSEIIGCICDKCDIFKDDDTQIVDGDNIQDSDNNDDLYKDIMAVKEDSIQEDSIQEDSIQEDSIQDNSSQDNSSQDNSSQDDNTKDEEILNEIKGLIDETLEELKESDNVSKELEEDN